MILWTLVVYVYVQCFFVGVVFSLGICLFVEWGGRGFAAGFGSWVAVLIIVNICHPVLVCRVRVVERFLYPTISLDDPRVKCCGCVKVVSGVRGGVITLGSWW